MTYKLGTYIQNKLELMDKDRIQIDRRIDDVKVVMDLKIEPLMPLIKFN